MSKAYPPIYITPIRFLNILENHCSVGPVGATYYCARLKLLVIRFESSIELQTYFDHPFSLVLLLLLDPISLNPGGFIYMFDYPDSAHVFFFSTQITKERWMK